MGTKPTIRRVAIDIGGTFTDLCLVTDTGQLWQAKHLTTPAEPAVGFLSLLDRAVDEFPQPSAIREVIHATTVATNAILESQVARMAMVTTSGFRDVVEIGRHFRRDLYNLFLEKPPVLVPRCRRFELDERVQADGSVLRPIDDDQLAAILTEVDQADVEVVLVCFLNSFANPDHENRVATAIREHCDVTVIASHSVCWEYREYERFSTAAVHGSIMPLVHGYLQRIEHGLIDRDVRAPLTVMQSNGGLATSSSVRQQPAVIVESGPAAGVIAAAAVGERLGYTDLICFDMGGTTAKASLIRDGQITVRNDYEVGGGLQGGYGTGYALRTPVVDLVEIGTGGGSICHVDPAGHLHVGPRSAGAEPGPACYGLGGRLPTVTDANAVLGRLQDDCFAGGAFSLDVAAATVAVQQEVCERCDLSVTAASEGVIAIANAQMVRALQLVSVERGYDPRDFTMVAFGGAGPMHAAELARELGCQRVVIPMEAGVQSAWGLLVADARRDASQSYMRAANKIDPIELEKVFSTLASAGRDELVASGFDAADLSYRIGVDARYVGQAWEVTVTVDEPPVFGPDLITQIVRDFHRTHMRLFGHSDESAAVEWVTLRATVVGPVPPMPTRTIDASETPLEQRVQGHREMVFSGTSSMAPIYRRCDLGRDDVVVGPALITQDETTVVVPPNTTASVMSSGDLLLEVRP